MAIVAVGLLAGGRGPTEDPGSRPRPPHAGQWRSKGAAAAPATTTTPHRVAPAGRLVAPEPRTTRAARAGWRRADLAGRRRWTRLPGRCAGPGRRGPTRRHPHRPGRLSRPPRCAVPPSPHLERRRRDRARAGPRPRFLPHRGPAAAAGRDPCHRHAASRPGRRWWSGLRWSAWPWLGRLSVLGCSLPLLEALRLVLDRPDPTESPHPKSPLGPTRPAPPCWSSSAGSSAAPSSCG